MFRLFCGFYSDGLSSWFGLNDLYQCNKLRVGLAAKLHSGRPSSALAKPFSELGSMLLQSIAIISDGHRSKASAAAALLKSNFSFPQTGTKISWYFISFCLDKYAYIGICTNLNFLVGISKSLTQWSIYGLFYSFVDASIWNFFMSRAALIKKNLVCCFCTFSTLLEAPLEVVLRVLPL